MKHLINRIERAIAKRFEKKLVLNQVNNVALERLGSDYGGWVIPKHYLNNESICYCVGAGLDISFDLAIAQQYKCNVQIIDPTPGALGHFNELVENTKNGNPTFTNKNVERYELTKEDLQYLNFHEVGLWDQDTTIKFYVPQNKDHISHSALNLQKTDDFFEAKVMKISTLMKEQNHDHIDLLKLDIEGAEYKVIENLLAEKLSIGVICIEFDENIQSNLDKNYIDRIQHTLDLLGKSNYVHIHAEEDNNFTLAKKEIAHRLQI